MGVGWGRGDEWGRGGAEVPIERSEGRGGGGGGAVTLCLSSGLSRNGPQIGLEVQTYWRGRL